MVYIIGAGGFSKQVVDILKMRNIPITGVFDNLLDKGSTYYYQYPIIDKIDNVKKYLKKDSKLFCGIGDNQFRKNIIQDLPEELFINCISPLSNISLTSILGYGNYVGHFSNIISDSKLGNFNFINDGVCIGHDVTIGNYNHLSPHVCLGGYVSIKDINFLGTNSTVIPKINIGNNNIIGSNTNIIKSISDNNKLVGNPAKII